MLFIWIIDDWKLLKMDHFETCFNVVHQCSGHGRSPCLFCLARSLLAPGWQLHKNYEQLNIFKPSPKPNSQTCKQVNLINKHKLWSAGSTTCINLLLSWRTSTICWRAWTWKRSKLRPRWTHCWPIGSSGSDAESNKNCDHQEMNTKMNYRMNYRMNYGNLIVEAFGLVFLTVRLQT